MNVLIVGRFHVEGFALHIEETLEEMGHVVYRFEPGASRGRLRGVVGHRIEQVRHLLHEATDRVRRVRTWRRRSLWRAIDGKTIDVVIATHDFLWPEEVAELKRRTGAAIAMWFPDHLANFGSGFFMNAPYDGLFFKDPYIVDRLGDAFAAPTHYLPECFNPVRHRALEMTEEERAAYSCDVVVAGTQHAYRVSILRQIEGPDVKIWGGPPPTWLDPGPLRALYQGRPVFNEDKAKAFVAAKIVLNTLYYAEIWGVNVRTFEAAGVGAFQLVDWRPGLEQLFADGKELVTHRSVDQLRDNINRWLPRDEERREIAVAARKRALAEHTYRHRLELLLDTLAGRASAFPMPSLNSTHRGPA